MDSEKDHQEGCLPEARHPRQLPLHGHRPVLKIPFHLLKTPLAEFFCDHQRTPETEKTLDEGYKALFHYMAQGYLHEVGGGAMLFGSSCYADLKAFNELARENAYRTEVKSQGASLLEDGTEEV
jgi:hypothetical protein